MRRPLRVATLAVALILVAAACGGSSAGGELRLDGSPRHPDDEGVATTVTLQEITLDGQRRFTLSEELVAFTVPDLALSPVLHFEGRYVQVGLEGSTIVWIGALGGVVPLDPPAVFHVGELAEITGDGRIVFADGTVLRLGDGVTPPTDGGFLRAEIDPASGRVRLLEAV